LEPRRAGKLLVNVEEFDIIGKKPGGYGRRNGERKIIDVN
jgi:hypothetical protein